MTANGPRRPAPTELPAELPAERRRRLAEVFGEELPETTGDERDPHDAAVAAGRGDTWLREQVPPHHGG